MVETLLASAIVFGASLIEASFGFGGGLIAIPLLSLLFSVKQSVTLFLIFQFLKGVLLFWGWRKVAWREIRYVLLLLPFGVFIGYSALTHVDAFWLNIGLAAYLLAFVFKRYLPLLGSISKAPSLAKQFMTGIGGGAVQGLIGTGGPFLVTYLQTLRLEKEALRFTAIFLLFFANAWRISFGASGDILNQEVLKLAVYCMPAYILAVVIGYRLPKLMTDAHFQKALSVLLTFSAAALLYKAFSAGL